MFCRICGSKLEDNANFCINCGSKTKTEDKNETNFNNENNSVSYQKNTDINISPKLLGCSTILAIVLILVVFIGILGSSTDKQFEEIAKNRSLFEEYGVSYENVEQVLDSCGYKDYEIKRDEEMDNYWGDKTIAFQIIFNDSPLSGITIKDNAIYNVYYIDNELYKDGQVIRKITDFFLTDDEKYDYIDNSKEVVKSQLTYPDTAKFPWLYDEYYVICTDRSDITVKGSVTASNAFNVPTTYTFEVKYNDKTAVDIILY